MRVYFTDEKTNTAYIRGHARGRKAFSEDESLFGSRRIKKGKQLIRQASQLTLMQKGALYDGFIDGAEQRSRELGWFSPTRSLQAEGE